MSAETAQRETAPESASTRRALWLVLLSGAFLILQISRTDYGPGGEDQGQVGFWFVVGAVLLWFVYKRRSAGARRVVIFLALVGAAIFGADAVSNSSSVLLALAYVGQAIPLMSAPVRRHVAAERG